MNDPTPTDLFLAVVQARERLMAGVTALLRPHGLSPAQYNVLRIVRGAGDDGLPCSTIAERLLTKGPDVTRLVDGLHKRRLVLRERSKEDRRVVLIRLHADTTELLSQIDEPMRELHARQFAGVDVSGRSRLLAALRRLAPEAPRER